MCVCSAIKFRWNVLPQQQREGIKTYIVNLVIKVSSDPKNLKEQKVFLSKANKVLVEVRRARRTCSLALPLRHRLMELLTDCELVVRARVPVQQVVKHEWPARWPGFIKEIVNSSKTSQSLCANNMNILKLLR